MQGNIRNFNHFHVYCIPCDQNLDVGKGVQRKRKDAGVGQNEDKRTVCDSRKWSDTDSWDVCITFKMLLFFRRASAVYRMSV